MDAWAARIAAAGVFCAEVLAAADVNAEMLALKCSTGGQVSAPFDVDLTNNPQHWKGSHFGRGE